MNKTFENKSVDIDGTRVLEYINYIIKSNIFSQRLRNDLKDIKKTKKIRLENIQELFSYILNSQYQNDFYYEMLKGLIKNNKMSAKSAIDSIELIRDDNEYLFYFLSNNFNHQYTSSGLIIEWIDDERKKIIENAALMIDRLDKMYEDELNEGEVL